MVILRNRAQSVREIHHSSARASNQIGAVAVANAAPDGYTMLVTAEATFVTNPWLYSKLPYNPIKDFVPISVGSKN